MTQPGSRPRSSWTSRGWSPPRTPSKRASMAFEGSPFASRDAISYIRPMKARTAKYAIGQVVRHRLFPLRGIILDVAPPFSNTEEWGLSIPEAIRPAKDQPFYRLFAENAETEYVAYVSEQNLLPDESGEPVRHPQVKQVFERARDGSYKQKEQRLN